MTITPVTQFDVGYPDNPWVGVDQNQRQWFDPLLIEMFRQKNVYSQFVTYRKSLLEARTTKMTVSMTYDLHPNTDTAGLRDIWFPASHIDSRNVEITFDRYWGKTAYNKYDDKLKTGITSGKLM